MAIPVAGHGSRFIPNTATMKLVDVANRALQFRQEQEAKLGYSGAQPPVASQKSPSSV